MHPSWVFAILLQGAAPAEVVAPASTSPAGWDAFPVLVWRHGRDEPREPIFAAFGGLQLGAEEDAAWARARNLEYLVFNAAGRDALHLERDAPSYRKRWSEWFETRDDRLLVREPCLADPATREALHAQLRRSLAARGGAHGLGVSLGDEVSLTPYGAPEDVCLCARCREAWPAWLASRAELADEDRAALADLAAISTDATRVALADGRTESLGPWLLRRRFHQDQVLALLEELARASRRQSPATSVGLLGIAGQSAFGGIAVERVLPWLDFAECYRTANARELLFTLRAPRQRAILTVFPKLEDGADRAAWQAWEHWLRGGDGLVVWSDRELARSPELVARLARAVREVREARRAAPDFAPAPAGVALLHSHEAIALAWLRDALLDGPTWPNRFQGWQEEHGTLETARRGWLRLFEDAGVQPGALPLSLLDAGATARFPLLVASHLAVLDAADIERLHAHLARGGRLLVQGELGTLDPRGRRRESAVVDALKAVGAERVELVGDDIAEYALRRVRPDSAGDAVATGWRARAARWLSASNVERPPWQWLGEAALEPWLCAWSRDASTGRIACAALPSAGDAGFEPARLRALALELRAPEGLAVEWLHPGAGDGGDAARVLAAGDAAVFRLVPRP